MLDKGVRRDPLTNTRLAQGENKLFTNWHVRREVTSFLERQPKDWTPSGWTDREVKPPKPTASLAGATEEVRTARERAVQVRVRTAAVAVGDRHLHSFLVLAALLTANVVVMVVSRRLTSAGGALIGPPFSPLVHGLPSGPAPPSPAPTPAQSPASLLPPVCEALLPEGVVVSDWLLPYPEPSAYHVDAVAYAAGRAVQYGSDPRLRVSYPPRRSPQQHCLSPRRCTMHEDRNPRLRITIAARYADWTTFVLLGWAMLWIAATTVWTFWSISVYWRCIPDRWRGAGDEELMLLPTASLSMLFTAPFWAIGATMLMQCAVASLAHTELELSPTSWSLHSTMLGGWELERSIGDIDDIAGFRAVGQTARWIAWPLGSMSLEAGDGAVLGSAVELATAQSGVHEFSRGLSEAGTKDLVRAALGYICRGQVLQHQV